MPEDLAGNLLTEFTELPKGDYSCVEGGPSENPFALAGKVCTFDDIISKEMNGSENDISNKTLDELSQMNVSVVCDLKANESTSTSWQLISLRLYIIGADYKIESIEEKEGKRIEYAMVKRDGYVYSNTLSEGGGYEELLGDCYWIKEKAVRRELSDFEAELRRTETDYSCSLGDFGKEKLETPGKVCTANDLLERM